MNKFLSIPQKPAGSSALSFGEFWGEAKRTSMKLFINEKFFKHIPRELVHSGALSSWRGLG
jgi:hypothetical protein